MNTARRCLRIDVARLHAGDLLLIITDDARYNLSMEENGIARLSNDCPCGLKGEIRILGCYVNESASISPHCICCGGEMVLTYEGAEKIHLSTVIHEIHWIRLA